MENRFVNQAVWLQIATPSTSHLPFTVWRKNYSGHEAREKWETLYLEQVFGLSVLGCRIKQYNMVDFTKEYS